MSFELSAEEQDLVSKVREEHRGLPLVNPHREREVLAAVCETFFSEQNTTELIERELQSLPLPWDINEVNTVRRRRAQQMSVVASKVSNLILETHPSYSNEMQRVGELQTALSSAHVQCHISRQFIEDSYSEFAMLGLRILRTHRKLQTLSLVHRAMNIIKTLCEADHSVKELMRVEQFESAVEMCLQCQRAARSYLSFHCVSDLCDKLRDTLVLIEQHLDLALRRICGQFDEGLYSELVSSHRTLNKTQVVIDQLLMYFTAEINSVALSVMATHLSFENSTAQYVELCQAVGPGSIQQALGDLCTRFWTVLHSYHCVLQWHANEVRTVQTDESEAQVVRKKLETGLSRLWQDASTKVKALMQSTDLTVLKFDHFLSILEILHLFVQVGRRNFASTSDSLIEVLQGTCSSYFENYHRSRMDELRMFLDFEPWVICPVKRNFSFLDLHEFAFLRHDGEHQSHTTAITFRSECATSDMRSFEYISPDSSNPFAEFLSASDPHSVHADSFTDCGNSEDGSEDERHTVMRTESHDSDAGGDILSSRCSAQIYRYASDLPPQLPTTALNVLRQFGRYLHMVHMLETLSTDVVEAIIEVFEYYVYNVYHFFGRDVVDLGVHAKSQRLSQVLDRISQSQRLYSGETGEGDCGFQVARLSSVAQTQLQYGDSLFALNERIIAVESVCFIGEQLKSLQEHLIKILPEHRHTHLSQLYSQTVHVLPDLRRLMSTAVSTKALNYAHILQLMSNVDWSVRELMSQHSEYVDFLVAGFDVFAMRIADCSKRISVPQEWNSLLWTIALQTVNRVLVEGYSNATVCSNEGRALMQLDYQQFVGRIFQLRQTQSLPEKTLVESYIKAYYMPEADLERWVKEHREYTVKQLCSLLHVVQHVSKRTRMRLIQELEDLLPQQRVVLP